MKTLMHDHGIEMLKGAVGLMAPVLGVLTSLQEGVEYYMRLGALAGGMAVSLLTAISIVRGWSKKRR
jgi:hypothetical protein